MGLLDSIGGPDDLRRLDAAQMVRLAAEIREFLVRQVSRTGGHLGPNLGVVELTLALHRVFRSPHDPIVFDTGHQSYVHKLLTGRQDFSRLRQRGGLSGYPSRAESVHDVVESSHASASLSWADGIAKAFQLRGETDRYVVAVVGDGALTGGMAWEALNNIAADHTRKLVIVVNDNGRSYAPTIGGLAHHLDTLRTTHGYEKFLEWGKDRLQRSGPPGRMLYDALHGLKKGVKDVVAPQGMFEDLGIKYVGPIDGHDEAAVERGLRQAKVFGGPVIVHVITEKGHGYAPARHDEADQFHAIGAIDPATGKPLAVSSGTSWTRVFADRMVAIGERRPEVVAVTGAMLIPVGLAPFAERFPERVFDVGIAEAHATASAAGLAFGGMHPVVALYSTFLGRAFDQVLMDVALHRAGVTFALDRAGVTGPDGASHHGMWDLALLQIVPGIRIAAPRDAPRLREELDEAVAIDDAPTVVRYPKGAVPEEIPAAERLPDGVDVLARHGAPDVLLVAVGPFAGLALEVADRLEDQGIGSTVVDPRWVLPVPASIVELSARHRLVICLEDGVRVAGVGSRIRQEMRAAGVDTGLNEVGLPDEFLGHGTRAEVLSDAGITARRITQDIVAQVLGAKVPYAKPEPDGAPRGALRPVPALPAVRGTQENDAQEKQAR